MSGLVVALVGAAWYIAIVVVGTAGVVEQPPEVPPESVGAALMSA